MIADAIHSIGDLASDFVVYIAILLGSREADENHQYGHRRYETLASLVVGLMIIAAGIGLGYEMINRIQDRSSWEVPGQLAMAAAAVSIIVKEILYRYTYSAGVKQNHPLMQANAVHHRTDALSSLVVLIGLVATEFGITVGDLAAALVVSFMLARAGLKIVYEALLEGLILFLKMKKVFILMIMRITPRKYLNCLNLRERFIHQKKLFLSFSLIGFQD